MIPKNQRRLWLLLWILFLVSCIICLSHAQEDEQSPKTPCHSAAEGDCVGCLSNTNSCVYAVGVCWDDCASVIESGIGTEAPCYTTGGSRRLTAAADVCERASRDSDVCTRQTNCRDCTSTTKPIDGNACVWYPTANDGRGACYPGGCGPFGCGTTYCTWYGQDIVLPDTDNNNNNDDDDDDATNNNQPQDDKEQPTTTTTTTTPSTTLRILTYEIPDMDLMNHKKSAAAYYEQTGIQVLFDEVPDFNGLYDEIRSLAELKLPIYDGYISGPAIVGTAVQWDGFVDLTDIVRDRTDLQWLDVLRGFRETIAVYDGKVRMLPLDGDAHFLYYRSDVLQAFNISHPPRTWDEYWQVAAKIHGQIYNGQKMIGSCVGRKMGGHTSYWTSLVLSSYTQTQGPTEGFIVDSKTLEPLFGEAMAETIKMLELQTKYGHPKENEFVGGGDSTSININAMNEGYCALTYNWGDSYKVSHTMDPPSTVAGLLKVAPTPGSTKVYNRVTKKLERCTQQLCGTTSSTTSTTTTTTSSSSSSSSDYRNNLGGEYYEDLGWINRAAYLAFGGWSASVNNNIIDEEQKQRIIDFFVFMCSPEISGDAAVPKANASRSEGNGVDPFRTSHMNVDLWVQQGYERTSAESYQQAVYRTLENPNAAYDMRFAGADLLYSAMEEEIYDYLQEAVWSTNSALAQTTDEAIKHEARMKVANRLEERFREIIYLEDNKPETIVPLLEQYQRDLGIYKESNNSKLNAVSITVPIVIAVILATCILVYVQKNNYNDSVWQVKKEELHFPDPQVIIGQGAFGLVLLAEYRGTKVAVKRVLPLNAKKQQLTNSNSNKYYEKSSDSNNTTSLDSALRHCDIHKVAQQQTPPIGTTTINARNQKLDTSSLVGMSQSRSTANRSTTRSTSSSVGGMQFTNTVKKEFIREMRHISRLRHPCITTVMGAVMIPNEEPMLIMEYMDHGSLYDMLHNKSMVLDGEILLPMLRDITQGCRFLHSSNPQVIHGDLKAANILVDCKFRAKVADFGLSQKKQLGVTGTPFWMAPELLRHETFNTTASDVYAFGIMLYEVYSREDPYEGENAIEVLTQVADPNINKRPPIPDGCPAQLVSVMEDCLHANPAERPTFEELDKRIKRVEIEPTAPTDEDRTTISLFDIFPKHIAEALRDGKEVKAEHKDPVTIFFSDIVGFTDISSTLEPQKVADLLDRLYQKFDSLSHTYDVFKVETIGDAYMAVTNLVKDQSDDHATRIADFAVDAIKAANETLIDKDAPEKGFVNIRVGFHSGSVVADVVGTRNPRYCLFGDSVNTAARMESNSKANRIHCSGKAVDYLRKQNCKYPIVPRGAIEVKGKGEMYTYWVNDRESVP